MIFERNEYTENNILGIVENNFIYSKTDIYILSLKNLIFFKFIKKKS